MTQGSRLKSMFRLRVSLAILALIATIAISDARPVAAQPPTFYTGGDISLLTYMEQHGQIYRDGGQPEDALKIFKDYGLNCMRLRLWVHPSHQGIFVNDLPYTIALGRRIKRAGFNLLLDFHYADSWADPGKQPKPAEWQNLAFPALVEQVKTYSRQVIAAMRKGGAMPDIVQVGNEITGGFIWPDGKLYPGSWDNFAALLKAGITGVKEGAKPAASPQIMIHIDRGGDSAGTRWFFDHLLEKGVDFDIIGESFYPQFHGPLSQAVDTLRDTALRYKKPIIVVEAGYPFQGTRWRGKAFTYPISPAGQRQFLIDLVEAVKQTPNGLGRGVIWWAPEWVPMHGSGGWGGLTLFDEDGNALPGMAALAGLFGPNTPYQLVNRSTGKALSLTETGTGSAADRNPADAFQQWEFKSDPSGQFRLYNLGYGHSLPAPAGSAGGSGDSAWDVVSAGNGYFRLIDASTHLALSADSDGATALRKPGASQDDEWQILPASPEPGK
jgi:arabinogalactan endo-1,4-beta-galactosidase